MGVLHKKWHEKGTPVSNFGEMKTASLFRATNTEPRGAKLVNPGSSVTLGVPSTTGTVHGTAKHRAFTVTNHGEICGSGALGAALDLQEALDK